MKYKIMIGLLLILAACSGQVDTTPVEKIDSIVIGVIGPMTGDAASYGEAMTRQAQLAVDEINANGGINGHPIELKIEDGKCNPKDSATAATKLINVDGVKVILGGACSGETMGAAPVAEKAQVILLSPLSTSPDITDAGDYIFRTAPSDLLQAEVAASNAYSMGYRKAAVLYENTDYSQALGKAFQKAFIEEGGEIVAAENYNTEDSDFRTQFLKMKEAEPDMIYLVPQSGPKAIALVKQLKEIGITQQIFGGELYVGRDIIAENPALLEGVYATEIMVDEENPLTKEIFAKYEAKYGPVPYPFYQAASRDAVYLLAEAIGKHGEDPEKIKEELYKTKDWDGAVGKLTLDEHGDALIDVSLKKIVQGQVIPVN